MEDKIFLLRTGYSSILILENDGTLKQGSHEIEDRPVLSAIVDRKGWNRGSSYKDTGLGKWMPVVDVVKILEENPEWIRTKVASKKFGL